MKKIISLFLTFCIMFSLFGRYVKADMISENVYTGNITPDELSAIFPQYERAFHKVISNNYISNPAGISEDTQRIEKETIEATTEDQVKYIVKFYNDDSYTALRWVANPKLSGGSETTTNTMYSCRGATLVLSDYVVGANKMFTISPISFTVYKSDYDVLDSISSFATASIEVDGKIQNYTKQRNSYYSNETASRRAGGHYNDIAGTYLAFEVGQNSWRVIYGGSYYNIGSKF